MAKKMSRSATKKLKRTKTGKVPKYAYFFGEGKAEGRAQMRNLLGGKGADLAEMANIKLPVPPGFTITTEVCTYYYQHNRQYPAGLKEQVEKNLQRIEKIMGAKFGDPSNPLLVSVRSGARASMPGMMETVLNIGLNDQTIQGLIKHTKNPRFAYDAYRRLLAMYSDVVMEKAEEGGAKEGKKTIRQQLEEELHKMKEEKGAKLDTELNADDLKQLVEIYKKKIRALLGREFPQDPWRQLWGSIGAVFASWQGKRAVEYRRIHSLPDDWGTAVNCQAMVFGNLGEDSGTGVAFTRNPATGEDKFYGEWLPNAQGEDVVAGIRTPYPINIIAKREDQKHLPSLEESMPEIYKQLADFRRTLELHYKDMQDIEFTIQKGRLWMLQTRTGKRTAQAAVRMAVEMAKEGLISKQEAVRRVHPADIDKLLHPMLDPNAEREFITKGLPASPGAAAGEIVFSADDAVELAKGGNPVILVRHETSPEDIHGMNAATAILTATGGLTSHAAVVARGMGKCCVVGCGEIKIDYELQQFSVNRRVFKRTDWITLDGSTGEVYAGRVPTVLPQMDENFFTLMRWADQIRRLGIRANADTPKDAEVARKFGAEGVGLCRTEHMFFAEERIRAMREMILAETREEREKALAKIEPLQRQDFIKIFNVMEGLPVTIRLLDPPLHEFLPKDDEAINELAKEMALPPERIKARVRQLEEFNPMLGFRGCRLGVMYPEISQMQVRAILEAAAELLKQDKKVLPEIMIPLVGITEEIEYFRKLVDEVAEEVIHCSGVKIKYALGTMIELPRASILADKIAQTAEFFSFGTNDLTQMTYGFSRDDVARFLPIYINKGILRHDVFQTLDQQGVGELVRLGVERGRAANPRLKIGICGEHGGDPESIKFCHRLGLDYVSCSPYRVPVARLAAAHAVLEEKKQKIPRRKSGRKIKKI